MNARARFASVLGAVLLVLVAALAACGSAPKDPDLIKRDLPVGQVDPKSGQFVPSDVLSSGGGFVDAGCCMVRFALPRVGDQVAARLVFPNAAYPMDDFDAGYWSGVACLPPTINYFYFEVGYAPDDPDAGDLLYVEAVNDALPVQQGTPFASEVNVFDAPDGGVCGGIDAQRYLTLPDAG